MVFPLHKGSCKGYLVQLTYNLEDSLVDVDFVLNASEILPAVQSAVIPTINQ